MRFINSMTSVLLLAVATTAGAQATSSPSGASAVSTTKDVFDVVFGGRFTSVDGQRARFERFRDLRSGPTLDRVRYQREAPAWVFSAGANRVGYRDERFQAGYERYGHLKLAFDWNQVPLSYNGRAVTPYTEVSPGVFRLPDAGQALVEAKTATPAVAFDSALRTFDLRARRDTADLRFSYAATHDLDLKASFTSTHRTGAQPFGASFGFSDAIELPVPLDHRSNDFNATAEWSNARGVAKLAYDGSWFRNQVGTLVWDNPLRLTDQTNATAYSTGEGSSQGRMALWPDSSAHTVSATGAVNLPGRSRAFAYVSVGTWLQDAQLLSHTINSAITGVSASRATAEAEARIVAMTYRFTSRPRNDIWFNAQVRTYDYDNRTPHFAVDQYVRLDGVAAPSVTGGSEPFGYSRTFFDADTSYTPLRFVAFRGGYGYERDHRTFRFLDKTIEQTVRASVDSSGLSWGTVRVQYDHSVRTGKGFDEEVLSEIGEQVSLRQFDISDRTKDRVSAIVQVTPSEMLAFDASVSAGKDHRPDAAFGLQDNNLRGASVGFDFTPSDMVIVGGSYTFERYTTLQRSRQASPGVQFNDPTRDWSTDMAERDHTASVSLELPKLTSKTSLRFGADSVRSRATYLYVLPQPSTLVTPVQLSPVVNRIHRATADLQHTLASRVSLGVGYAFDTYHVEDFALGADALTRALIPAYVNLVNVWAPYTAHSGYVRMLYRW